jgi:chemotaxis protein MotB
MTVETAWAGNWYEHVNPVGKLAEVLDRDLKPTRMIVTTPRNRADYDGLTQLLAVLNLGTTVRQIMISYVEPSKIPACADQLSFLVFGPELWRGAEGFLNGIRHTDLTVLPDMGGIHLKFKFDRSRDNTQQWFASPRTLTVATRLGAASKEIQLLGDGSKCPTEVTNTSTDRASTNTSTDRASTVSQQQYDAVLAKNKELRQQLEQSQAQQRFVEAGDLLFPAGGFQLSTTGQAELTKNILPRLRGLQNVKIVVYGYTDNTPVTRELQRKRIRNNLDLSTLRATTVATYLTTEGVDPNIVSAKGFGETHPVASNDTPGGRAANRRIEITIQGPGAPGS